MEVLFKKKKKKRREIGQNTIRKKKGNNNLKERQESIDKYRKISTQKVSLKCVQAKKEMDTRVNTKEKERL